MTATGGKTPLVELSHVSSGLPGRVVTKLEMRNLWESLKERMGTTFVDDTEHQSREAATREDIGRADR